MEEGRIYLDGSGSVVWEVARAVLYLLIMKPGNTFRASGSSRVAGMVIGVGETRIGDGS